MNKSMRRLVFLLLLILTPTILGQNTDQTYNYEEFQQQFQRTYVGEQRQRHKLLFEKNYAEFLMAKQKNPNLRVNQFLDWDDDQKNAFFNYKPNPLLAKKYQLKATGATPPDTLDYRNLGKVTSVKNQGNCGCCWAYASIAVFESQFLIKENKTYDLSQQYLLECEKNSFSCSGGYSSKALMLLNQTGAPLQTVYPYQAQSPFYSSLPNNQICSDTSTYLKLSTPASTVSFISTMTQDQIRLQLATYGPISVGVKGSWNTFMYSPSTGIIDDCPSDAAIDHSVLLVGYTATHWIIKNSWGTYWGDQGFGYISKTNDCGLKRYMVLFETPQVLPKVKITIDMSDSKRNGWGGWTLGLLQGSTVVANFTLASGSIGQKIVEIDERYITKVAVISTGTSTSSRQIAFKLSYTANNTAIYTRPAGATIYYNTVFTLFCPSSPNTCTTPPATATATITANSAETATSVSSMEQEQAQQDDRIMRMGLNKLEIGLIASTSILTAICIALIFLLIYKAKMHTNQKQINPKQADQVVGSASDLQRQSMSTGKQSNDIK